MRNSDTVTLPSPCRSTCTIYAIPLDLIDQIIANAVNAVPHDIYDKAPVKTFQNVSLVNSYFKDSALRQSQFFETQCFDSSQRLRDYMRFVKAHPASTIPSRIKTLRLELGDDIEPDWLDMYYNAIHAFYTWKDHFPNITEVHVSVMDFDIAYVSRPYQLENAMRGLIASPSLHSLYLKGLNLPDDFFSDAGPALQKLQLCSVNEARGSLSFPKGLVSLRTKYFNDLILAHEASRADPEIFSSIDELSIDGCWSRCHDSWGDSWGFIYTLSQSLRKLELSLTAVDGDKVVEYRHYHLDISKLPKLEALTVSMTSGTKASAYIPWLSEVFRSLNITLRRQPRFALQVRVYVDHEELAKFDEWITGFFPSKMWLEVIVLHKRCDDITNYEAKFSNCERRGILRVELEVVASV